MTPDRWKRVEEILDSALKVDPRDRNAFLDETCSRDAELRGEVERLLLESVHANAAPARTESLAPGEILAGRFRVKSLIGRGGMGEVYEAQDELLKEDVALKTLRVDLTRSVSTRSHFQREIQLA